LKLRDDAPSHAGDDHATSVLAHKTEFFGEPFGFGASGGNPSIHRAQP
jgi:hypothetical protein